MLIEKLYIRMSALKRPRFLYKIFRYFRKFFGEKDPGNLPFNFDNEPNRIDIIQSIINKKNYTSYLEIGTYQDEVFSKISCSHKIGVDPFSGGNRRMTSDNFFFNNKDKFDCIFIDGLHHYNQVKKDLKNSINCLNENGIILIHDCLPKSLAAQAVPRTENDWNGDVWKSLVEQRTKQNTDCYTIYADHGIGVILKRKNRKPLVLNEKDFKKLRFDYFYTKHHEIMNILKYNDFIEIFEQY